MSRNDQANLTIGDFPYDENLICKQLDGLEKLRCIRDNDPNKQLLFDLFWSSKPDVKSAGNDWSPSDYQPNRSNEELGRDEKWQITSNQVMQAWLAWPAALERYDEYILARTGYRMTAAHRAHVTQRYRERLRAEHGTAEIDPRWESMYAERVKIRDERERRGR